MLEIFVIAEGVTEEQFIKQLVAPAVRPLQMAMKPLLLNTSQSAKGGAVTFARLQFNARNTLRQHPDAVLGTFLDLYALATDFPDFDESQKQADVYQRVSRLEVAMRDAIVTHVGCRPERFLPHIQPYEFEGLLFSNVAALCAVEPTWAKSQTTLANVRAGAASPERINDGFDTKPSKRLQDLLHPKYKKTLHGPKAAQRITLEVMERECPHFGAWMNAVRGLAN
jgi:hypothetical protein